MLAFGEAPIAEQGDAINLPFTVVNRAPIVSGAIAGMPVSFLFDTGAPVSSLDRSVVDSLAITPEETSIPVGDSAVPVDVFAVTFGDEAIDVGFQVKDLSALLNSGIQASGVLGTSLLLQYTVAIDPDAQLIRLAPTS